MNQEDKVKHPFPDLNFEELRLLCFIAFFGEGCGSSTTNYLKQYHITKQSHDDTILRLVQKGYLMTHDMVATVHHLDILDYVATEKPEWLEEFRRVRSSQTHSCDYLWRLAKLLRVDDFQGAASIPKPYEGLGKKLFNVYSYIRKRALTDPRYSHLLDSKQIFHMTAETLENLFQQGSLDELALESIRRMTPSYHPQYQELMDRIALYDFFVTGKMEPRHPSNTIWNLSLRAIRALYRDETEDALALFKKAIQIQGKRAGAFKIPLVNYYYVLCVIKFRTKYEQLKETEAMDGLRQASSIKTDNRNYAAKLLLDYAELPSESSAMEVLRRINMVNDYDDSHQNRCLALLLANFFKLPKEESGRF